MAENGATARLGFGTRIDTEDGTQVGRIRGFDEEGSDVTMREGLEGMSVEQSARGRTSARPTSCGAAGSVAKWAGSTRSCPSAASCGAEREELYYWTGE